MKRIIIIPLIVLLIVGTSFSVSAVPQNVVSLKIPVEMQAQWGNTLVTDIFEIRYKSANLPDISSDYVENISPLETGNIYFHFWDGIWNYSGSTTKIPAGDFGLRYNLKMPEAGDVVIAVPSECSLGSVSDYDFENSSDLNLLLNGSVVEFDFLYTESISQVAYRVFMQYYGGDKNNSFEADYLLSTGESDYHPIGSIISFPMSFYSISDIPRDSTITLEIGYGSIYMDMDTYGYEELSDAYYGMPFGMFVTNYEPIDLFGSWVDPDLPFVDNVDQINSILKIALDQCVDITEKQFFSSYASYQLDSLLAASDADYMENAVALNSKLDNIIETMNSTSANFNGYRAALDQFSDAYIEALASAETPEQGDYITAVYQAKQDQLYNYAVINSNRQLHQVVKSEDINEIRDLNDAEEEMFSQLNLQKLEDVVSYQTWFNLMSSAEAMTYRSIFDFFLYDAAWKYWIVVPMTFLIVSALLGTAIRVAGRPRRSRTKGD